MSIPDESFPDGPDIRVIEELIDLAREGNKVASKELLKLARENNKAALSGLIGLARGGNKIALGCLANLAQAGNKGAFEELVKLARVNNEEACAFLFDQYNDRVFSYILRILSNVDDAQEFTQQTFLKAFESLSQLKSPALFRSWLFRIAHNLAIDHTRRRRYRDEIPFSEIEWPVSLEPYESEDRIAVRYEGARSPDFSDRVAEKDQIDSILALMPPKQRMCFLLKEVAGLSLPEIAEILGIGQPTITTYLSMARRFFKEHYDSHQE